MKDFLLYSRDTLIKSILPPLGDVFSRGRIDGYAFNERIPNKFYHRMQDKC